MGDVLKEINESLKTLVENSKYQQKLLEEVMLSKDQQSKQKQQVMQSLQKYREMMNDSPVMKANPELAKAVTSLFDGLTPPEEG